MHLNKGMRFAMIEGEIKDDGVAVEEKQMK